MNHNFHSHSHDLLCLMQYSGKCGVIIRLSNVRSVNNTLAHGRPPLQSGVLTKVIGDIMVTEIVTPRKCEFVDVKLSTSATGEYFKRNGFPFQVVDVDPWTNLSGQQCQPSYNNMFFNLATKGGLTLNSVKYTIEEAFNGGGCYVITGQVKPSQTTSKGVAR